MPVGTTLTHQLQKIMSATNTQYVDGFVLPLAKAKLAEYQALAEKAAAIWMEYGALEYRECVGDDSLWSAGWLA